MVDMGTTTLRTPMGVAKLSPGEVQRYGKAFFGSPSGNKRSVCAKTSNCSFLVPDVYNLRLLTYRDLLLEPDNPFPCVQ